MKIWRVHLEAGGAERVMEFTGKGITMEMERCSDLFIDVNRYGKKIASLSAQHVVSIEKVKVKETKGTKDNG